MSIFKDIVDEEKERLTNLIKFYEDEIIKLPKGTLSRKKIKNKIYVYLVYRKNGIHHTEYIGPEDSEKVEKIEKKIKERKELMKLLKHAKMNLKEVNKFKHGK